MKGFTSPAKDSRPYEHLTFIQEDPTLPSQRKKPRTLTACDRCRARKVKCEQAVSTDRCDACLLARQECSFKARDQRFHHPGSTQGVEGTFQIQGDVSPNQLDDLQDVGQSENASSSTLRNKTPSPPMQRAASRIGSLLSPKRSNSATGRKVPGPVVPETILSDPSASVRSIRPLSKAPASSPSRQQHASASPTMSFATSPPLSPVTSQASSLFDYPSNPTFPRRDHLQSLIGTFFDHFGPLFPFLKRDDIVQRVNAGRLWNVHALGIAALASRFSNLQEHSAEPKYQHSDAYLNVAKPLITQYKGQPSLKSVQGLILLAWAECGNILQQDHDNVAALLGPGSPTMTYIAETVRVARALGLGFKAKIASFNADPEEVLATWWSVFLIDELTAWSNNQPAMLGDADHDHDFIWGSNSLPLDSFQQVLALSLQRRRVASYILSPSVAHGHKLAAIEDMRRVYSNVCRARQHLDLRYQNFQASLQAGTSPLYLAFHAVYFSVMTRSRLLGFTSVNVSPGSDKDPAIMSSRNLLEIVRWCNGGNRTRGAASNLFLEAPLYDAGSLLLSEHRLVANTPLDTGRHLKEVNECLVALQDMGRVWAKASVRAASLAISIEPSFNIMPSNMSASFGMTTMGHVSEYASHDQIAPIAPSAVYAAAGWNHHPTGVSHFHDSHSLASNQLAQAHYEQAYMMPGGTRSSPSSSSPQIKQHHTPPNHMWTHPR